jgi:hypothetical protein
MAIDMDCVAYEILGVGFEKTKLQILAFVHHLFFCKSKRLILKPVELMGHPTYLENKFILTLFQPF